MNPFLSFAKSTVQQVVQWWQQLNIAEETLPVTRQVADRLQRLRQELDQVILTRLPQFRDVVADDPGSEHTTDAPTPASDSASPPGSEESLSSPSVPGLHDRRQEAARVIDQCSWWAAANALNPVPGLDIKIDLSIFAHMTRTVCAAYNLSEAEIEVLQANTEARLREDYDPVPHLVRHLAPTMSREATAWGLRRIGMNILAREATKWVPVVGSAFAAGIGYFMINRTGEQLRRECEEAALAAQTSPAMAE